MEKKWLLPCQTMSLGLCNATATFQRLLQSALIDLFSKHCIIYLDETPVFIKGIREHNPSLKLVLGCLRYTGMTLNLKKCCSLQCFVSSPSDGMDVIEDRTKQARTLITPTNQMKFCSLLGLTNYYRRFVEGFVKIASPLHRLNGKQAKKNYKQGNEHDESFNELKRTLLPTDRGITEIQSECPTLRTGYRRERCSRDRCTSIKGQRRKAVHRLREF